MPKKMYWIETLFVRVPVAKRLVDQILLRLFFSFLLWLSGFVAFSLDGLGAQYASSPQLILTFFGSGFIILFGSYMIQESLAKAVLSIRPLLRLDDSEFEKFIERVELYTYSFIPDFLIGLLFVFVLPGNRVNLAQLAGMLQSIHGVWNLVLILYFGLLNATGIWMGVSIWITVFLISRQPLHVELSSKTVREFRELANLALAFAAFYFLAIAIGVVIPLASTPIASLTDLLLSPLLLYVVIGAIGVSLPFYNIHRTLVSLKRQELLRIEAEYELMETQLNAVQKEPMQEGGGQSLALIDSLLSLQIRERRVKAAKEWPIDIGFVSKLLGLILAPAMARILPEILNWLNL